MNIVLSQFTFLICVFSMSKKNFEVEARPKEVIAVPGWFNSVEGFYFPSSNLHGPKTLKQHSAPTQLDSGDVDSKDKRRKRNKRRKTSKKITRRFDDEETKRDKHKDHKKKKRKTKLNKLKFLKTTVKDNDYSTLSVSKETRDKKRKPVDITVHIKMND